MTFIINGYPQQFNEKVTILEILDYLKVRDKVMAVAVNMNVIQKKDWGRYYPVDEDLIELLHFVGGG